MDMTTEDNNRFSDSSFQQEACSTESFLRELTSEEVSEVSGGWATVAVGAVGGALAGAATADANGSNVWAGAALGAASGAFMGAGGGLLTSGISLAGRTASSATAGVTSFGFGLGLSAAGAYG